ncbi:MAG: glycosyltransferase [Actinomycetota bacterium]
MDPKISVIIPCYNSARYLPSALDSVFSQTYQDFEVIAIDDGSTDSTREVLDIFLSKYPDKLRYLYQQNQGPSAARNKGIRHSKGEYVAFLDTDDIWLKEKLELQVKALSGTKAGLVYTDYYIEDMISGESFSHRCRPFNRMKFKKEFLLDNQISTPTLLIEKKCFEISGVFDESLHVAEDWDLWYRLFKVTDFVHLPYFLVKVRVRSGSQSSDPVRNLRNDLLFLEKIFADPAIKNRVVLKAQAYSFRYYKAAIAYKDIRNRKGVILCCLKSLFIFPFGLFNKKFLYLLLWSVLGERLILRLRGKQEGEINR